MNRQISKELIDFINKSPSSFQAAENIENILKENNFIELKENVNWKIKENRNYYVKKNNSAIIAFKTQKDTLENGFKIIASHLDSPSFLVKPNSVINFENHYIKLNVEPYGGVILNTWYDRPLSLSGRVTIRSKNIFRPEEKILTIKKPLLIIPNLAIHMNKDINNGYKYNPQKDMLPLIGIVNEKFEKDNYLINLISEELNIQKSDIIDFELFLYEYEKGVLTGRNDEFISASRLDDLMMVFTSLKAFLKTDNRSFINVCVFVDNEEVGSKTAQGAFGSFTKNILERLVFCLKGEIESKYKMMSSSIMLSADMAHAIHPNYPESNDITTKPKLGKGIVIKQSSNQEYSTNSISYSIVSQLCEQFKIPYQRFVNRSGVKGGSTIGPIFASEFSIPVADVGAPLLSMHSIRELASSYDVYYCYEVFKEFYQYE